MHQLFVLFAVAEGFWYCFFWVPLRHYVYSLENAELDPPRKAELRKEKSVSLSLPLDSSSVWSCRTG